MLIRLTVRILLAVALLGAPSVFYGGGQSSVWAQSNTPEWQKLYETSKSVFDEAEKLMQQGKIDEAIPKYETACDSANNLRLKYPKNLELFVHSRRCKDKLSLAWQEKGEYKKIIKYSKEIIKQTKKELSIMPTVADMTALYLIDLSDMHVQIAKAEFDQNNYDEAMQNYQNATGIIQDLVKNDPHIPRWKTHLAHLYIDIAKELVEIDRNHPELKNYFREIIAISKKIADSKESAENGIDPDAWRKAAEKYKSWLEGYEFRLLLRTSTAKKEHAKALTAFEKGEWENAIKALQTGIKVTEEIGADNLTDTQVKEIEAFRQLLTSYHFLYGVELRKQKKYEDAIKNFQIASDIIQEFFLGEPLSPKWVGYHANMERQLGETLHEKGNLPEALQNYQTATEITQNLIKNNPDTPKWKADLANMYIDIVKILEKQDHDHPELKNYYRDVSVISEEIAESGIRPDEWYQAAVEYNWRLEQYELRSFLRTSTAKEEHAKALTAYEKGEWENAIKALQTGIKVTEEIGANNLTDTQVKEIKAFRELLLTYHFWFGIELRKQKKYEVAIKNYQIASDMIQEFFVGGNPPSVTWLEYHANTERHLGGTLYEQGNLPEALNAQKKVVEIVKTLIEIEPNNDKHQLRLAKENDFLDKIIHDQGK